MSGPDVAVVGAGPNGLAAAVIMARAGLPVDVYERAATAGGGLRTRALFDDDVGHDICSAVHPLAPVSRFFREFNLAARGVTLATADIAYAHPLGTRHAAIAYQSLERTCAGLGQDGPRWHRLMAPLVNRSASVVDLMLSPQRRPPDDIPAAALAMSRAVLLANRATSRLMLSTARARALLAGVEAHAIGKLPSLTGAAVALLLGHLAHSTGWGIPLGGSGSIADAMIADLRAHGGRIITGTEIKSLSELAEYQTILLDTSPQGFLSLAGEDGLPPRYRHALARFRYGPGAAKADFLLGEPVPWSNRDVRGAGTVHLGGDQGAVYRQEALTARGQPSAEPFVLVVDPATADPGRAKNGKRPLWAYAHVPNGDTRDPVRLIRAVIERYAPGFTDTILNARGIPAARYQDHNLNYVGGDIGGGAITTRQMIARPAARIDPYRTPIRGVYLCSASTPPGPAVHGMCGYHAARSALRREYGIGALPSLSPAPENIL